MLLVAGMLSVNVHVHTVYRDFFFHSIHITFYAFWRFGVYSVDLFQIYYIL